MDMSFVQGFNWIFLVVSVVGIALALWAASETPANLQARHDRYQRQNWSSAQSQRRTRVDAEYRENVHAKIDASRRSRTTAAA